MELINVFEELLTNHKVENWEVSLNGERKGPVSHGAIGLSRLSLFWATFTFTVDGTVHTVSANRPLTGGDASVLFDTKPVTGAHLTLSKHLVGFPPHLRVEIDIVLNDHERYRFDGTVI